jgi:hypothetical protein
MLGCEARYRVENPQAAAAALDRALEPNEGDGWTQWIEVDGRKWMRAEVSLDGDVLKLTANSEGRFERITELVREAVGGIELVDERRVSAAEIARRSLGRTPPEHDDQPGVEALDAFMREQERRWVDEAVPALAGLTPRQAAADPTRREDLIALLRDFDRRKPPPGAATFDTRRLRLLLGLRDQ